MNEPRKVCEMQPGVSTDGLLTWFKAADDSPVFAIEFTHFPPEHRPRILAEFDAWLRSGLAGAAFEAFVKAGKPAPNGAELRVA